jgi:hypothetical protein
MVPTYKTYFYSYVTDSFFYFLLSVFLLIYFPISHLVLWQCNCTSRENVIPTLQGRLGCFVKLEKSDVAGLLHVFEK